MSSGIKRPHADDAHSASGRSDRSDRKKPRDWRDAFLDDGAPPRDRDRDHGRRDRDQGRGGYGDRREMNGGRHGGYGGYYDRDRGYDDQRGPSGGHGSTRDREDYREREPSRGEYSRRYGDRNDYRQDSRYDDRQRPREDDPRRQQGQQGQQLRGGPPPTHASRPSPSAPQISVKLPPAAPPQGKAGMDQFFQAEPEEPEPEPEVVEEEQDPAKMLEERRRKREEIMAKFKATGGKPTVPNVVVNEVGGGAESVTSGGTRTGLQTSTGKSLACSDKSLADSPIAATPMLNNLGIQSSNPPSATPTITEQPSLAHTPQGKAFDLAKHPFASNDSAPLPPDAQTPSGVHADMTVSAADYDPTQEALADHEKRQKDLEAVKPDPQNATAREIADGVGEPVTVEDDDSPKEEEWEEVEIEVDDEEDDEFDMFDAFGDDEKQKKKKKVTVRRLKNGGQAGAREEIINKPASTIAPEVVDNVDDADGYYRITPGEIVDDGRYQITISLGKGMFSAVVKAKVLKAVGQERRQDVVGKEVAIKVVRSQESMYISGRKEAQILKKLNDADPDDKKHMLRLDRIFEHRGHLCIVTESLSMNLRDVIKRFGNNVGLNMRAVRAYAHQLFLGLSLMRKCEVVHADIKPDNILASHSTTTLKICDLGSAAEITEGEITPYLVSRFYRAPEIILGLPYDTAIDMWSIGCTLYELFTGKILFPGRSNNHMLLLMMELKGKINHRMIKKASFGTMHFDEAMNFIGLEKDKITGQDTLKTHVINKPTKDLRARLVPSSSEQLKMKDDELKQLLSFVDLLDKCLHLDPAKRITPRDALLHPFMTGH
ncbi:CMGC/DYRK/PRP4 protein kinase [Cryptococcus wingfieldii CBS 7118]|uniref:non-specific serine/threonine protein kinase n=1 Tax=Cryptococcus wingfieldii CBS 7118 TaxID=1295528 RepID=A0A1E3K5A9_9TREE|nr:CMGC/DYRK/PRP4 protein kinase [Cryptococcus wingfieldii CBS 7118]ODO07432.1 CMGC/DYRK/PRP4 protein kinase [Cryptococcus wingfieldii CBS 7118]